VLAADGIKAEIFEKEPGRGNLVARLKGSGKQRPILLMGHLDTVGVERSKWSVDPFEPVEKDGYLYGRGTTDDKTSTAVFLQIFRMLHRLKVPLDRDVIFVAEAAEETEASLGIEFLIEKHWDKIAAEFALKYVAVSPEEKVPRRLFLSATGVSGHGSRPPPHNAIVHLAAAVAKVAAWQPPLRFNAVTRVYFERLGRGSSPGDAGGYGALEEPSTGNHSSHAIPAELDAAHLHFSDGD